MRLHGTRDTKTLRGRQALLAQDPGFQQGALTEDGAEEDKKLYAKEHGNEAHELDRCEGAFLSAWRDKEELELRELLWKKERAPPTPLSAERFA